MNGTSFSSIITMIKDTLKDEFNSEKIKNIITSHPTESNQIWVIGDNPQSVLKAGHELGLRTIQRIKDKKTPSIYAEFTIQSFAELETIIG